MNSCLGEEKDLVDGVAQQDVVERHLAHVGAQLVGRQFREALKGKLH